MVRAPCCEKMGLKKGPWTAGEDHVLVSYIQRFGHGNWRALPKQAGLLRCGKSCRLRWINYLRPDIKRGNFSKEEEDTIIDLHRALGNRWSAIAAKLPGRTDNEIKNVWHTYLKKRVNSNDVVKEPKKKTRNKTASEDNKPITLKQEQECTKAHALLEASSNVSVPSPSESYNSDLSSTVAESSSHGFDDSNNGVIQEEWMHPSIEVPDIDDSFWSEVISMESYTAPMDVSKDGTAAAQFDHSSLRTSDSSGDADGVDFWLRVFMEAGDLEDLPEI